METIQSNIVLLTNLTNDLDKFFKKNNIEANKYLIDKIDNIEYQNSNMCKLIHKVCQYSYPETIKYIIDKGVDLECETADKFKPIHYICIYSTLEIVKYIIDKGVDLECEIASKFNFKCICHTKNNKVYNS